MKSNVSVKELQDMYDWINKHMAKNYWGDVNIDYIQNRDDHMETSSSHSCHANIFVLERTLGLYLYKQYANESKRSNRKR